jgi:hypothetical protein
MIFFTGTKSIRGEYFLCFSNDNKSEVEIPVSAQVKEWFMRYLDRLSPPIKDVEGSF